MIDHSQPAQLLRDVAYVGMFGVDLFFCLSGFLIGRILIKDAEFWAEKPQAGLLRFWYRRWMRTLPLYFFFLLVWLDYDWKGPTTLGEQLPYLVFAQNLAWPMSDFYLLTWSLAVEEWFYFIAPLLVLTAIGFGRSIRASLAFAIVALIVGPFLMRLGVPGKITDTVPFDEGIRHIVIYRLDAIGFGVATAYIYCYHRPLFARIARFWYLTLLPLAAVVALPKTGYPGMIDNALWMSLYLTVSGLAFAFLIPAFDSLGVSGDNPAIRFVRMTSRLSYSMYLGHIIAFIFVMAILRRVSLFEAVYPNPWLVYPLFILATYILASLTYHCVERPFLFLRDRSQTSRTDSRPSLLGKRNA